jgi:dynein intermediate chain 2
MNSNKPVVELVPPSPLCCLRYNPKSSDTLVGGSYNGTISYYDLRKHPTGKCHPSDCSVVENSHHDPVADIFWISSKTGHQCVSTSTDGQMLWWDTRKLEEPIDSLMLATDVKGGSGMTLGGSSLEYNIEAGPTKFLVGTEQGIVMSLNMRNKKTNNGITVFDNGPGKHMGPIFSIQRNPTHSKYFMTVGDWTARIWTEDLKTPIITTKYHKSYLTGGCWSPTRAGVFYVTRSDGVMDIWDISHTQNEVAYSHKVSDAALSSISIDGTTQGGGKLVAVGDANGTVSMLEVCDSLAVPQLNEKSTVNAMLERETKRERIFEVREREVKRAKAQEEERKRREEREAEGDSKDKDAEAMRQLEEEFFRLIKDDVVSN